ncbi:DUF3349 domain-containing protein [Flexivirga meconopsidis]|uniref:DUF3349 domain-containing protein n=1 Tax=Flexivirga meconopsidis TaxID=2977121 RepID=UPI00223F9CB5|nr:DUF3349 domain-containing protein [Flexivirga meconopsidis]
MTVNPLISVVDWLRKGYPEGIPPKDFPPLLALLQRSLSPEEVQAVCAQVIADNPDGAIAREHVASAVQQIKDAPPSDEEINEIASRLAAVGWPLSIPDEQEDDPSGSGWPPVFQRILGWLRAGYPDGVPPTDFPPILALLQRRLTKDEVKQVARELIAGEKAGGAGVDGADKTPISEEDAQALIQQVAGVAPSEDDLDRVRARLAKKGWPLV